MFSHLRYEAWLRVNVELLAISLDFLATLDLQGPVYSDCQGFVMKLLHPNVIRRTPASAGFLLIRACARRLQHPSRSLQCAR